jgi:DNA-binding beta-propeller fold protein YncE
MWWITTATSVLRSSRRITGYTTRVLRLVRVASTMLAMTALVTLGSSLAASEPPLRIVRDIPLPGPVSRFDYASLDERRGLLFMAHLGAGTVVVFDTHAQRVVAEIRHIAQVHGVLAIPELDRLYATATGTNEVVAIDETTYRIVARMPGGEYPDGLAYDSVTDNVFISDEAGGTDTAIDVKTNRTVRQIALGGEAGNTQYDPVSHRIFVDVQTRNDLTEIEPGSGPIVARYALPGCTHDHGLVIDGPRRMAFIACDGNATLLAFDLRTKRVTDTQRVGPDPDVLALDPGLRRLYVAAESGIVTVFAEAGVRLHLLGQIDAPYAHVVVADPKSHDVYLPLQNVGGHPALRIAVPPP